MKITLDDVQLLEAIRLYATIITGYDLKSANIKYLDTYNQSVSSVKQVEITLAKAPSVPAPSKINKEITQAEVDQVYSSLVGRKLDLS